MSSLEYSEKILLIMQRDNPKTVIEVINKAKKEFNIPRLKTLETIETLRDNEEINLINNYKDTPKNIFQYFISLSSSWYWTTIILSLFLPMSQIMNADNTYPFLFIRLISNSISLLFLPGYSLSKILFNEKEIDHIEKLAYSIGISIVTLPLIGFLLNYSHWEISFYPLTLSLSGITIIAATIGLIIEHRQKLKKTSSLP